MEKEQPREASRAPSCKDVNSKIGELQRGSVRDHKGLGCNVALIKCTLGPGKPKGGLEFCKGGYRGPDGEQGELVYKQPGTEVDDSCHS
jgi:hypothetical protein